jgi:hypothetical protein
VRRESRLSLIEAAKELAIAGGEQAFSEHGDGQFVGVDGVDVYIRDCVKTKIFSCDRILYVLHKR